MWTAKQAKHMAERQSLNPSIQLPPDNDLAFICIRIHICRYLFARNVSDHNLCLSSKQQEVSAVVTIISISTDYNKSSETLAVVP